MNANMFKTVGAAVVLLGGAAGASVAHSFVITGALVVWAFANPDTAAALEWNPDTGEVTDIPEVEGPGAVPAPASRTVTVEGRFFYNDLRESGHFQWRRDLAGNVGQKVGFSPGAMNLLAAWYVVADFYELDTVDTSTSHPTCKAEESLGSSTINFRVSTA